MTSRSLSHIAALAAIIAAGTPVVAHAGAPDRQQPYAIVAQATQSPRSGGTAAQGEEGHAGRPEMMPPGMMHPGMMGGPMSGMMPMMGMHGPMLKIIFAIADTNGDGALSFEEVTALHKRIFDAMDTNKDGKVTLEEIEAFMWD